MIRQAPKDFVWRSDIMSEKLVLMIFIEEQLLVKRIQKNLIMENPNLLEYNRHNISYNSESLIL